MAGDFARPVIRHMGWAGPYARDRAPDTYQPAGKLTVTVQSVAGPEVL